MAATHGRGFWILDDLTPLREARSTAAEFVLYSPEPALRLYYPDAVNTRGAVGANPPAGAVIDYVLARRRPRPNSPWTLAMPRVVPDKTSLQHKDQQRSAAARVAGSNCGRTI